MFTSVSQTSRDSFRFSLGLAGALVVFVFVATGSAANAAENEGTENPPRAKLIVDPPQAELLARGVVVIEHRTENVHLLPVFGAAALAVSPRIGHLHVTVDDGPFVLAHTSGQPLIVADLPAGPHKITIELADANHQALAGEVVQFEVPQRSRSQTDQSDSKAGGSQPAAHKADGLGAGSPGAEQPAAKLIVDRPLPGPLSRGVAFVQYRTENVQIAPVFGVAALAILPRVGHLHVTVDDAPWHWADASGGPVIVSGLPAGPHKIVIELADANHQPLAEEVVTFEVPRSARK